MRAQFLMGSIFAAAVAVWSCGGSGGGYGSSSPSTPSPTPTSPSNSVTINIVGSSGPTAFSPNPAQAASGSTIVWKNSDSRTHNIVMDDGLVLVGSLAPGASSAPVPLRGSGGNYHCSIHPSMVGGINGAPAPPPSDNPSPGY